MSSIMVNVKQKKTLDSKIILKLESFSFNISLMLMLNKYQHSTSLSKILCPVCSHKTGRGLVMGCRRILVVVVGGAL